MNLKSIRNNRKVKLTRNTNGFRFMMEKHGTKEFYNIQNNVIGKIKRQQLIHYQASIILSCSTKETYTICKENCKIYLEYRRGQI